LIHKCKAIHTWFMRIPIDVLFLSAGGRIEHVIPAMEPWHTSKVVWSARDTLECFPGTIAKCNLQVGDELRIEAALADLSSVPG